jgi:penicillin V acylase-like amidase (Ntn superfamily)
MNRTLIALTLASALAGLGAGSAEACTSMIFKAEDGTRIYARTMEWGASDLKSVWDSEPVSGGFDPHSLPPVTKWL